MLVHRGIEHCFKNNSTENWNVSPLYSPNINPEIDRRYGTLSRIYQELREWVSSEKKHIYQKDDYAVRRFHRKLLPSASTYDSNNPI